MASDTPAGKSELLVISTSARFLVEAAVAAGYAPGSVDGFADAEVRSLARSAARVPFAGDGLDADAARRVCERLIGRRRFAGAVVGSGFDASPGFIGWLSSRLPVHANSAGVFALCRDHDRFVERLRRLGVPHPPRDGEGRGAPTLEKLMGANGGAHVRFATRGTPSRRGFYRQSYCPATVVSHLFIATGDGVVSIGWNTQWQSRHDASRPFCYGGAVNRGLLTGAQRARAEDYAARLARDFSLVGINGVDYVVCGDEMYLLELNPRVTATVQLHEDDAGTLFTAHLDACRSPGPFSRPRLPASQPPRAHAVVYATRPLVLPRGFDWPAGARDLPDAQSTYRRAPGEPVCTLTARARTAAEVLARLQHSIRSLNARLARQRARIEERPAAFAVTPCAAGGARA